MKEKALISKIGEIDFNSRRHEILAKRLEQFIHWELGLSDLKVRFVAQDITNESLRIIPQAVR